MDSLNNIAGGFGIHFGSKLKYQILWCTKKFSDGNEFPTSTNLPSRKDMVWRISLNKSSGTRLIVHCNGVEVLNVLLSSSVCTGYRNWKDLWNKKATMIYFSSVDDTASDYYRNPHQGIT
jgi:hypothetical protein